MAVKELSQSVVEAEQKAPPAKGNRVVWDSVVTGLGIRVTANGHASFVYRYVIGGREKRFTLGEYGKAPKPTVSVARERVRKRDFRKDGKQLSPDDPLGEVEAYRSAKTVEELCDRYLEEHAKPRKRPSSVRDDTAMIDNVIKPKLGSWKVAGIAFEDVDSLHRSMNAAPYRANCVLALLSKMFSLASARWHYRTDNPCKGVERFPEERREQYLTRTNCSACCALCPHTRTSSQPT